ncbi:shikimate dehydrogenase [Pseudoduganella sp. GCM10020061]|uniref:shikimate dehydrogenase n=1 Tax=Pseudoduganella sp. GCM10020061 TaxID=3317345 RepID=UPI00363ED342
MADRYCVIGNPVAHSKSPEIHAAFARDCGIDLTYGTCLAPLDGFAATVRALAAQGFSGANVTVPFKLEAAQLCDVLSARATAAGAVNTLVFRDGRIEGDNTDGAGLVADIVRNAGVPLHGKRVLLLGAGGAARGVMLPLLAEGPRELVIANRTRATAEALAARFADAGAVRASGFEELDGTFDVIVNATSASLADSVPPVPPQAFSPDTLALDMMYGKQPTVFMEFAAQNGARVRDGLGMLVEQAAEAFYVWRGVRPATQGILRQLRTQ